MSDTERLEPEHALRILRNMHVFITSKQQAKEPEGGELYLECLEVFGEVIAELRQERRDFVDDVRKSEYEGEINRQAAELENLQADYSALARENEALQAERDALKVALEPFTRLPVPSTPFLLRYCKKAREATKDE